MQTLRSESATVARRLPRALVLFAREPETPWEAKGFTDLVPPASLEEARMRRDELTRLLGHERAAAADFLLALADFDRRRGWAQLGYATLFAFLSGELKLSNGAAWSRSCAARLLPRFPAVEAALRDGKLCLSSVGELARVLTVENEAEVLHRFFGASSREAKVLVAAIRPDPSPPRREVVTRVTGVIRVTGVATAAPGATPAATPAAAPMSLFDLPLHPAPSPALEAALADGSADSLVDGLRQAPFTAPLRAHEVRITHPTRGGDAEVEPLTADLRRLHLTVSAGFLAKVARARDGLSHSMPRAGTEQVLEKALDLLLEMQARRKSLVKRPRTPTPTPTPTATETSADAMSSRAAHPEPFVFAPLKRSYAQDRLRAGDAGPKSRETETAPRAPVSIPAAIEREVRLRDGDRCQFPLDGGGICGSTWQIELDHLVPQTLGGPSTVSNLRCACDPHNQYAAELALGEAVMATTRRSRRRPRPPRRSR